MKSSTLYLRKPEKAKQGKRKPKSARQDVGRALFRWRVELAPAGFAFALIWATWIVSRWGIWIMPSALLLMAGLAYQYGDKVEWTKLARKVKRIYVSILFALSGVWSLFAVLWNEDHKPSIKWIIILALVMYPAAFPWLRYRSIRGSVRVTFDSRIPARLKRSQTKRARGAVMGWDGYVRASAAAGSDLQAIHFDPWSVTLSVRLGHARVAEDFTELRLRRLESAFEARRDSARVLPEKEASSRLAKIRFMLADPLKEAILPEDLDNEIPDDDDLAIIIGRFEYGAPVIMDLIHTLIAGASGMGKSGILNAIMRALVKKANVAIFGIDLKPGGLELGKWEDLMVQCAGTPLAAKILLMRLLKAIDRRGAIMKERGIRKWVPTPEEPFIVLIVDEVQELKAPLGADGEIVKGLFNLLIRLSCLGRAYGFALVLATQHPKDTQVPATAIANCLQRIGLKCEASTGERLIFGDDATKTGWRLTGLRGDREGGFRIRSKRYRDPNLARAAWISDQEVTVTVERFRATRTEIDAGTWHGQIEGGTEYLPIEGGTDEPDDTVDAVIVEDDPEVLTLMAIVAGHGTPKDIASAIGASRATVVRALKALKDAGAIEQDGTRKPWRVKSRG